MTSYRYQKRKPTNLSRISSCVPGSVDETWGCYYPQGGTKCGDMSEEDILMGKCDARRRTRMTAINLSKIEQVRYHLDKARTRYWSAVSFRRKYSAYMPDGRDDTILLDGKGYGLLRAGFVWEPDTRRRDDGFSPPGMIAALSDKEWGIGSDASLEWRYSNGKRYHFQAEALMRNGKTGTMGAAGHMQRAWNLFREIITVDKFLLLDVSETLSEGELTALSRYAVTESKFGNVRLDILYPNLAPGAFYASEYEPIIRGLPTGKNRTPPVKDIVTTTDYIARIRGLIEAPSEEVPFESLSLSQEEMDEILKMPIIEIPPEEEETRPRPRPRPLPRGFLEEEEEFPLQGFEFLSKEEIDEILPLPPWFLDEESGGPPEEVVPEEEEDEFMKRLNLMEWQMNLDIFDRDFE